MSTTSPCSGSSRRPESRRSGATRTPPSRRGRLGGASIEVCYEITAVVGGVRTFFVQAETTIVLLDAESGRPRRVTEAEREVWRRYSGPPEPDAVAATIQHAEDQRSRRRHGTGGPEYRRHTSRSASVTLRGRPDSASSSTMVVSACTKTVRTPPTTAVISKQTSMLAPPSRPRLLGGVRVAPERRDSGLLEEPEHGDVVDMPVGVQVAPAHRDRDVQPHELRRRDRLPPAAASAACRVRTRAASTSSTGVTTSSSATPVTASRSRAVASLA